MSKTDRLEGKVRRCRGESFYLIEKPLSELDTGPIDSYIEKHRESLLLRNLRRKFPELEHIPKERMLFFDIETCGFDPNNPIIAIAMAHMHHQYEIMLQCLFARNYSEEKAVIQYFLDSLPNYHAFFTYNGNAFDILRIQARAIQNGLFNGKRKLDSMFNGEHYDLYLLGKEKSRIFLPDAKLQTVERLLFGFNRDSDVECDKIPELYFEYVYGRKAKTRKVITNPFLWKKCEKEIQEIEEKSFDKDEPRCRKTIEALYEKMGGKFRNEFYPGKVIDEKERARDMENIIRHNMLDTRTLAAILCYLCSPHPEQKSDQTSLIQT